MKLTTDQIDALTEIVNIGVGRAVASLSRLVDDRIQLNVPSIQVSKLSELSTNLGSQSIELDTTIVQDFDGVDSGRALLAFPRASGIRLGQTIIGADETVDELDVDLSGILEEVGNIVLNGVIGSICNIIGEAIVYKVPELHTDVPPEALIENHLQSDNTDNDYVLVADAHFRIDQRDVSGSLLIAFDIGGIDLILSALHAMGASS